MKKISILALAAMAMVSCANTYTAKNVDLVSQSDSVNYAVGYLNGTMIKAQQLAEDSSETAVTEFIDALNRGYNAKPVEDVNEAANVGRNLGIYTKNSEKTGLAENKAWTLNEKMFFQGLINGLYEDTTVMIADSARNYYQVQYTASMGKEEGAGKPIKSSCPKKAKTVKLKNFTDSINYAFGYLNGSEIKMYVLASDSTGEDTKEFIAAVNKAMKVRAEYPQLVNMGEQIGAAIRKQEPEGLLGEPKLITNFELIKQGFINGLKGYDSILNQQDAQVYVQTTMDNLKYGESKAQNERFLAENALKEGVKVTESGLQYEVIKEGRGKRPTAADRVKVHYHGTLIDGTVFDSSVDRGEPITFALSQVIPGWTEGLQLMTVGSKYKFYIPQELGYGNRPAGSIPPYSTLIFEVELLGIEN